jgi:hypothetical protein
MMQDGMERYIANANKAVAELQGEVSLLKNQLRVEREAKNVLAEELAAWRHMPHLDHIRDGYWADVPEGMDYLVRWGENVNANETAREAVKAWERNLEPGAEANP